RCTHSWQKAPSPAPVSNQFVNRGSNLSACGFAGEFGVSSGGFVAQPPILSMDGKTDNARRLQPPR
ncbi:hypothetical protein, partial [Thermoleptolyngbya sp. M55_K2018_002]|uniref:hypothetical protein n=1 Tax=Thermoleptolyngbya sp. M55_K2018_002 TaxID=2747808 RepID=UPI0025D82C22